MLNIYIEKLEQLEGGLYITARVLQPYYDKERIVRPPPDEEAKALAEHDKLTDEYHHLHLGSAWLQQRAGG